jgi:hypothetical protein
VERRSDKIRKLQTDIALLEILRVSLGKTPIVQVLLDNMKKQLTYEKQLELEEVKRLVFAQSTNKNWQDNINGYIVVGINIAVIAGLIIFFLTSTTLFSGR